jgi:membrane protein DedA with SNARE-associated domain
MENEVPDSRSKPSLLKNRLISILLLSLVIAIAIGVFLIWRYYPEKVEQLKGLGYFGVFIISVSLNATVVLPAGNFAAMAALANTLPPVGFLGLSFPAPLMVGIIGGLGAGIGESTGYLAGCSGQTVVAGRKNLYDRLVPWLKRWGMLLIFAFSIVPLVFDVVGLAAGAVRYPYWKFLVSCWLGRTVLYIGLSFAAVLGWGAISRFFS